MHFKMPTNSNNETHVRARD